MKISDVFWNAAQEIGGGCNRIFWAIDAVTDDAALAEEAEAIFGVLFHPTGDYGLGYKWSKQEHRRVALLLAHWIALNQERDERRLFKTLNEFRTA